MACKEYTPSPEAWNRFMTGLSKLVGDDFREATEHPGTCRCELCLQWWATISPNDDGKYGPFTKAEVSAEKVVALALQEVGEDELQEVDDG